MTAPKFCLTAFWNWRSNVPGAAGRKGPGADPRPLWAGPSLFGQKGAVKLRRLFAFVKGKGRPVVPAVSAGTLPSECFVSNMDAPGSVALNGLFFYRRGAPLPSQRAMRSLQKRKKSARIVFSVTMLRCAALPRSRDGTFPFCSSLLIRSGQSKPWRLSPIPSACCPFVFFREVQAPIIPKGTRSFRAFGLYNFTMRGRVIEAAKGAENDVNFHRPCRTVCLFRNKEAWKPSQGIFETASMLCGARDVSMLFNVADL